MFHDMGLTKAHSSDDERFEVDGANAARDFLKRHGIAQTDIDTVWTAIALHTTPGIPNHMHPVVALLDGGRRDGRPWPRLRRIFQLRRKAVVKAFPRTAHFKEDILFRPSMTA